MGVVRGLDWSWKKGLFFWDSFLVFPFFFTGCWGSLGLGLGYSAKELLFLVLGGERGVGFGPFGRWFPCLGWFTVAVAVAVAVRLGLGLGGRDGWIIR